MNSRSDELDWKSSFDNYLNKNYNEGQKVEFDSTTEEFLVDLENERRSKSGQYDKDDKLTKVPRYRLRGYPINDKNHLKFKVWLQREIEDTTTGEKSKHLLWSDKKIEGRPPDKEEAEETLFRLGDDILGVALGKTLFQNESSKQTKDLHQLLIIESIYNYHLIVNHPLSQFIKEDKPDYNSKEYKAFTEGKSFMTKIYTKIIEILIRECKYRIIEDKNKLKKMHFTIPGITFLEKLSKELVSTIDKYTEKIIEIMKETDKSILNKVDKNILDELHENGFGSRQGLDKKLYDKSEITNHNCIKLAYNILNELLYHNILTCRPMTLEEYKSHYTKSDGAEPNTRERIKDSPHLLSFSESFITNIKHATLKDFENKEENAIFRWFKNDQDRYMYCPPINHILKENGEATKGGFIKQNKRKIISNHEIYESFGKAKLTLNNEIIDTLNTLQNTQWEINLHLLEKICDIYIENISGKEILKGPIIEKNSLISAIKIKSEFKDAFYYENKERYINTNLERQLSLDYCKKIIDHNANVFWHTWFLDGRGRLYTRCNQLSPQDSDLNKALIRFKEWKKLGKDGLKWFYILIHNQFNGIVNKKWKNNGESAKKLEPFEKREKWVKNNVEELRRLARNPSNQSNKKILGLDKLSGSKSQAFQRLASILELDRIWNEYEKNILDFSEITSGLPVTLDASCNGYQHISALMRDKKLAKLVNILPSGKNKIRDLYSVVAHEAKEYYEGEGGNDLRTILKKNGFSKEELNQISEGEYFFQRNLAKQPVITTSYGSTDITKSLIGKRGGKGKPGFATLDVEEVNTNLHDEIKQGYEDYINGKHNYRSFSNISKKFKKIGNNYELRPKDKSGRIRETKKINKKYAKDWEDKLKKTKIKQVWHPESPLYINIVKNNSNSEIARKFNSESTEKEQVRIVHELQQKTISPLTKIYRNGIDKATNKVFESVILNLKRTAINNPDEKFPGGSSENSFNKKYNKMMYYDNIIQWKLKDGLIVRNYYVGTFSSEQSSKGGPTKKGSAYSSLDMSWYTLSRAKAKQRYNFDSLPKSTIRVLEKIKTIPELKNLINDQISTSLSLNSQEKLSLLIKKSNNKEHKKEVKTSIEEILSILNKESDNKGHKKELKDSIEEIRRVLLRYDYSIPRYPPSSSPEKSSLNFKTYKKVLSSIAPNFIHSLDAYHMRSVINALKSEIPSLSFWAIHDEFGTHACDIEKMVTTARDVFYTMHQDRDINWWLNHMREGNASKMNIDQDFKWPSEEIEKSNYIIS